MIKKFIDKERGRSHSGTCLDSQNGYDVITCRQCQFKHVSPLPSNKELAKFYEGKFYSHAKPDYFKYMEEDLSWWTETYRNYYRILERHTSGRRLLDIGSGPGYFLKCGQERGWKVLGVEPSQKAYEYSSKLGVDVVNKVYSAELAKYYGLFDVIFMFTVLEHLPDPQKILEISYGALNHGGLIMIVSPNDYNPLQKILRKNLGFDPWWVAPPQHLNYFDFKSVKKFLERLGFTVVDLLATFPMEFFLLAGDNYVGKDKLGRKCHARRKAFEEHLYRHNPELLNGLYRALAKSGVGREFVIIGRK